MCLTLGQSIEKILSVFAGTNNAYGSIVSAF